MPIPPSAVPFQQVLDALLDTDTPLNPRYLGHFSDLEGRAFDLLKEIWPRVPTWRRKALLEDVEQLEETDTLVSFEALARFALKDEDPEVRLPAVRILWEYDVNDLIPVFLDMLHADPSVEVRAAAANILGRFVFVGELDELPAGKLDRIVDNLLEVFHSKEDDLVRRRALESLGYSSREEIRPLIELAYHSDDKNWVASALYAMGRSADPAWGPDVMEMLDSPHPVVRAEAARAAGEIDLTTATRRLFELLNDPDADTRAASIWSLSQLGGDGVRKKLERLLKYSNDDEERSLLESALDNLIFNEELDLMPLFDLSETNPADDGEVEDAYILEELEEDFQDEFGEDEDFDDDDFEEFPGGKSDWLEDEDDAEDQD